MATLTVTENTDYREEVHLVVDISQIVFTTNARARFYTHYFLQGAISQTVAITGTAGVNEIYLYASSTFNPPTSAAGWTFTSGWDQNDIIVFFGAETSDTFIGTSQNDTLLGLLGVDVLAGGDGNDRFNVETASEVVAGEWRDGGNGVDSIDVFIANTLVNLAATAITSMEQVYLAENAIVALAGAQIGAGAINTVKGDVGKQSLSIFGSVDLSGVTFQNWTADDSVSIFGLSGADILIGSSVNDMIFGSAGADFINGGEGYDVASYLTAGAGVTVHLGVGGFAGDAEGDIFASIEALVGSTFSDVLLGGENAGDIIYGSSGGDYVFGLGGNDVLYGNEGVDVLYGGAGSDILVGGLFEQDYFIFAASDMAANTFDVINDFEGHDNDLILLQGWNPLTTGLFDAHGGTYITSGDVGHTGGIFIPFWPVSLVQDQIGFI